MTPGGRDDGLRSTGWPAESNKNPPDTPITQSRIGTATGAAGGLLSPAIQVGSTQMFLCRARCRAKLWLTITIQRRLRTTNRRCTAYMARRKDSTAKIAEHLSLRLCNLYRSACSPVRFTGEATATQRGGGRRLVAGDPHSLPRLMICTCAACSNPACSNPACINPARLASLSLLGQPVDRRIQHGVAL